MIVEIALQDTAAKKHDAANRLEQEQEQEQIHLVETPTMPLSVQPTKTKKPIKTKKQKINIRPHGKTKKIKFIIENDTL